MAASTTALLTLVLAVQGDSRTARPPDLLCGAYSTYVAVRLAGGAQETFDGLLETFGTPGPFGYSMLDMERVGQSRGCRTASLTTDLAGLRRLLDAGAVPVARMHPAHFVVIDAVTDDGVSVIDAPDRLDYSRNLFDGMWSGEVVVFSTQPIPDLSPSWWGRWLLPAAAAAVLFLVGGVLWRRRTTTESASG